MMIGARVKGLKRAWPQLVYDLITFHFRCISSFLGRKWIVFHTRDSSPIFFIRFLLLPWPELVPVFFSFFFGIPVCHKSPNIKWRNRNGNFFEYTEKIKDDFQKRLCTVHIVIFSLSLFNGRSWLSFFGKRQKNGWSVGGGDITHTQKKRGNIKNKRWKCQPEKWREPTSWVWCVQ
jgi:hypothetical protein